MWSWGKQQQVWACAIKCAVNRLNVKSKFSPHTRLLSIKLKFRFLNCAHKPVHDSVLQGESLIVVPQRFRVRFKNVIAIVAENSSGAFLSTKKNFSKSFRKVSIYSENCCCCLYWWFLWIKCASLILLQHLQVHHVCLSDSVIFATKGSSGQVQASVTSKPTRLHLPFTLTSGMWTFRSISFLTLHTQALEALKPALHLNQL